MTLYNLLIDVLTISCFLLYPLWYIYKELEEKVSLYPLDYEKYHEKRNESQTLSTTSNGLRYR